MPPESNVESTLVWFEAANEKNTEYWIGALDEFLECKLIIISMTTSKLNIVKSFYSLHSSEEGRRKKSRRLQFWQPAKQWKSVSCWCVV